MNDPKVVALIYRVEHGKSVSYDNAGPLRYSSSPEFELTVEDNTARFEFKKHYASEGEALEAVEPFIDQWEFEALMQVGSGSFSLWYERAEIIDQNPSPPEPGVRRLRAIFRSKPPTITARLSRVLPQYPPPPAGGSVDLGDPCVVKMKSRYEKYSLGRTTLPDAVNICLTSLEEKYKDRSSAAKAIGVSEKILGKIGDLGSNKGGIDEARKAIGTDKEFTDQERRFLKEAVRKIIIRAAQVAADDSQHLPQITMADLPSL